MPRQGRRLLIGSIAAFLVPVSVGLAHSWGFHKATERTTSITLSGKMMLQDGKTLPAGTYQVEVPDNSQAPVVKFLQDGNVVASAKAKVVNQQDKNRYTEVDSSTRGGTQVITTIRPEGWHEILRFRPSGQGGSGSGGR